MAEWRDQSPAPSFTHHPSSPTPIGDLLKDLTLPQLAGRTT